MGSYESGWLIWDRWHADKPTTDPYNFVSINNITVSNVYKSSMNNLFLYNGSVPFQDMPPIRHDTYSHLTFASQQFWIKLSSTFSQWSLDWKILTSFTHWNPFVLILVLKKKGKKNKKTRFYFASYELKLFYDFYCDHLYIKITYFFYQNWHIWWSILLVVSSRWFKIEYIHISKFCIY